MVDELLEEQVVGGRQFADETEEAMASLGEVFNLGTTHEVVVEVEREERFGKISQELLEERGESVDVHVLERHLRCI